MYTGGRKFEASDPAARHATRQGRREADHDGSSRAPLASLPRYSDARESSLK